MADREKRGETKIDEIKNIFIGFEGLSFGQNKNLIKNSGQKL